MTSESTLPPELIQAYKETHYKVLGPVGLTLIVNQPNSQLDRLHRAHRTDCSAFVTACNPLGTELSPAQNAARQLALADELRQGGYAFVEALGQHPTNGWTGEPSFLIMGLTLEASKVLGAQLEQNAIVWCGADAVPRLVLLR